VELQDVATRKQIKTLADFTECPPEKAKLLALCENDEIYRKEVLGKHKMLIDLLEEFPACELPFNIFLEMLPPLRPRYYSISSSPLMNEKTCSITVAVVDAPARSGHGIYHGVCSSYLAKMGKGRNLYAFVRDTGSAFRLPEDPAVPVIMVGPGTGIAPFRGFLQERAALKAQGENVGKALLFFGCRHPEQDFIYEQELKDFEQKGVSEVFVAFSRQNPEVKVYVQDILGGDHQDKVWELIEQGAYIYVCGDASKMAPAVRLAFAKIYANKTGVDMPTAEAWIDDLAKQERYLVDVWAAS
jgi:cytochrome P450/NADPH-cytochrome P450 reductase